jgi:hypothetical protein
MLPQVPSSHYPRDELSTRQTIREAKHPVSEINELIYAKLNRIGSLHYP